MRAVEVWLAETGWGSTDILTSVNEDISLKEGLEGAEDLKDSEDGNSGGDSEDEVSDGDVASNITHSDVESNSDIDPDVEYLSSENDEETMDGEYGFSSL